MSWNCPVCGFANITDDTVRCACGYELPAEKPKDFNTSQYKTASELLRFFNNTIDCIVIVIVIIAFYTLMEILGFKLSETIDQITTYVIILLYYILSEGFTSRTCGKYLTKTKVLRYDGSNITFGQAIGRSLCRFIPLDALSYIFAAAGWHDRIPKTIVVSLNQPNTVTLLQDESICSSVLTEQSHLH